MVVTKTASRKTWLVGDGPCEYLAKPEVRHQRHQLQLFGEGHRGRYHNEAPTLYNSRASAAQSRFFKERPVDLQQVSAVIERTKSSMSRGASGPGIAASEAISPKVMSMANIKKKLVGTSGKVGSSHWKPRGATPGSWDLNVFDAEKWEGPTTITFNPPRRASQGSDTFAPPAAVAKEYKRVEGEGSKAQRVLLTHTLRHQDTSHHHAGGGHHAH
jgi:hypothetical protein